MAFSIPYREHAHASYWGTINSAANFCEEDNIITPYIAEFINTLTNATYLYFALHGIRANSGRRDAILRNLPYLGIACVGIGSSVFHSTMMNYTQWCDELSMHIATATVFHRLYTFDKTLTTTVTSGTIGALLMAAFIAWHCYTDELIMHSILFGVMIVIVGSKTRSLISTRVRSRAVRKEVRRLVNWGSTSFISGFALWNLDQIFCSTLTSWKRGIGMPWSFVLELHGWWHILTGVGAYIFIALVEYLTSEEAGEPLGKNFAWPVGRLVDCHAGEAKANGGGEVSGNGHTNGVVKEAGIKDD